jgi:MATE family multidrug resistance protein
MQFPAFILHWTFQHQNVLMLATHYAHALLWSTPSVIILAILEYFLIGIGKTKLSLWISLLQVPLEVFLMYVFIFGKFGMPAYGVAGVGYGLTASFTVIVIILIIYLYYARSMQPYRLFKYLGQFNRSIFNEIIHVGLPVGVMYSIEVATFVIATFFIARVSTVNLAAHQIAMQYLSVTITIAYAMSQAVATRVGQNIGRGNIIGVRYASFVGIGITFLFMLVVCLVYLFYPHMLLRLDFDISDSRNFSLMKQALGFLTILGIYQLLDSCRIIEAGALRGLKDTRYSMYISLITFWLIGLVSAYLLGFIYHWHGIGVWVGLTLGVAVGVVILFVRLYYKLGTLGTQPSISNGTSI